MPLVDDEVDAAVAADARVPDSVLVELSVDEEAPAGAGAGSGAGAGDGLEKEGARGRRDSRPSPESRNEAAAEPREDTDRLEKRDSVADALADAEEDDEEAEPGAASREAGRKIGVGSTFSASAERLWLSGEVPLVGPLPIPVGESLPLLLLDLASISRRCLILLSAANSPAEICGDGESAELGIRLGVMSSDDGDGVPMGDAFTELLRLREGIKSRFLRRIAFDMIFMAC